MLAPLTAPRSTVAGLLAAVLHLLLVQVTAATAQDPAAQPALRPPLQLSDGWTTGNLTDAGIAPDSLLELIKEIRAHAYPDVHSVLITRGGRLVFEAYFPGNAYDYQAEGLRGPWTEFGPETLHNTASVTKSITGLVVGVALDEGCLPGPDAPLF